MKRDDVQPETLLHLWDAVELLDRYKKRLIEKLAMIRANAPTEAAVGWNAALDAVIEMLKKET